MLTRNRCLSVLIAASYTLAVTSAALFHHHGDGCGRHEGRTSAVAEGHECGDKTHAHGDGLPASKVPPSSSDDRDCSVCQFLAQKTVPASDVAEVASAALEQEFSLPRLMRFVSHSVAAWHSRAPPVLA